MTGKARTVFIGIALLIAAAAAGYVIEAWQSWQSVGRAPSKADSYFLAAADATDEITRQHNFSLALRQWLALEERGVPMDGQLTRDIATSYLNLQQYPWALLYFRRAQKLLPRDLAVEKGLQRTVQALGITLPQHTVFFRLLFPFNIFFSPQERTAMLEIFSLLALCCGIVYVVTKKTELLAATLLLIAVAAFIGINIAYDRYIIPAEAVVVEATMLRPQPGEDIGQLPHTLTAPGDLVDVLEVSDDGLWIKISPPHNAFGYVPYKNVRLVFP